MVAGAFEKVGVEALVEGLSSFASDIGEVNSLIDSVGKEGSLLGGIFEPVGNILDFFGERLLNIADVAAGIIVANTLGRLTQFITDIGQEALEAGERFQTMQIRLEGLLARDFQSEQGIPFVEALEQAIPVVSTLFDWIQRLALQSPFDIEDVANILTLGKSYGFATELAQDLTQATTDFASGMGLGNLEMVRVIENLGQMVQQGKITGTELRDLGRGAFVPVNELLNRMQERLGLTGDEFDDFKKTGEGVNEFIAEFVNFVGTDFPGAGQRASRTLVAVRGNFLDLLQGVLGFNIVRPVLDVLATRAAEFLDAFTTGDRGDRVIAIAQGIGEALSGLAELFIGQLPGVEDFADTVVNAFGRLQGVLVGLQSILQAVFSGDATGAQGLAAFLEMLGVPPGVIDTYWNLIDAVDNLQDKYIEIRDRVLDAIKVFQDEGFVAGLQTLGVPDFVIEFIDDIVTGFNNLRTFWDENGEAILGIFASIFGSAQEIGESGAETILGVLGEQFDRFTSALVKDGPSAVELLDDIATILDEKVVPAIIVFGDWVLENQDRIVDFLIGFAIGLRLAATALPIVAIGLLVLLSPLLLLPAAIAGAVVLFATFIGIMVAFRNEVTRASVAVTDWLVRAMNDLVLAVGNFFGTAWAIGRTIIDGIFTGFHTRSGEFLDWVKGMAGRILGFGGSFFAVAWSIGRSIIEGIISGFLSLAGTFFSIIVTLAINAWNTVKAILGIGSPSKLFMEVGQSMIEGMIVGIEQMERLLQTSLATTIATAVAPVVTPTAAASSSSVTNVTNQNFGLTVHTAAPTEPIIADFRMMEALAQGGA